MLSRQFVDRWLAPIGFALIFVGFLSVWLPNKAAGLALLGLEIGEWVKFLPEVQFGQLPVDRRWFYLPPIALGGGLALFSAEWPNTLGTWLIRALALLASSLALPSPPDIINNFADSQPRILWVVGVAILCLLAGWISRSQRLVGILLILLALLAAILPTWTFFTLRPIIANWFQKPVGIGYGLWLNLLGQTALALTGLSLLRKQPSHP